MSASRLRRVGNLGVLVDPAKVTAVYRHGKPQGVRIALEGGLVVDATRIGLISGRETDAATTADVDKVWHQLTDRGT
jgi:hypothetical protein